MLVPFCLLLSAVGLLAQPTNDNFADAQDVTALNGGLFGSVSNDLSLATAEPGEPSHAGFPANATIWYKWTAPQNGEIQLDTLSSPFGSDTVLAVYTGNTLGTLRQIAANDDLFPIAQQNESSDFFPGFGLFSFLVQQPKGASALRFNAKGGTTYYFVVGSVSAGGPVTLGWAYHPSGVFRFATEDAVVQLDPSGLFFLEPGYKCAEGESFGPEEASTVETYYNFGVTGVVVTVTRVAGATGRMLVDYATEDLPPPLIDPLLTGLDSAVAGTDYAAVQGTLVFDDYEMTKRIVVPINFSVFEPQPNRDFAVVLSNARADAAESPNVAPPRLDGFYDRVIVRIYDQDVDPVWASNFQPDPTDTNMPPVNPPIFQPTNSIFNFSRVAFRTPEDVDGRQRGKS